MLCHTPVVGADEQFPAGDVFADVGGPLRREQLTPERIENLLERLAASQAPESRSTAGLLNGLAGKGKGPALLLAGAGGLVLLAGGLLALYVLGTLV